MVLSEQCFAPGHAPKFLREATQVIASQCYCLYLLSSKQFYEQCKM